LEFVSDFVVVSLSNHFGFRVSDFEFMPRIAVDIVLLPDQAMTDLVICANARLVKNFNSEIMLNKNGCLPHISLAMGCIDSETIPALAQVLESLEKITPKRLKSVGISKTLNQSNQVISSVQIERFAGLQNLHEKICLLVKPFFTGDISQDMFANGRAGRSALQWVKNYLVESAYENFYPHITVGVGDLGNYELPTDFSVSCLAVCHLADHCTCAKILWLAKI
jgi:hypothetical protein